MNIFKKLFVLNTCLFLFQGLIFGQQIRLDVVVKPPFTPKISRYLDDPEKLIFWATNTSGETKRIRFQLTIKGRENGLIFKTNENYIPPNPVTLDNVPRQFTSLDLEEMGLELSEEDYTLTGLSEKERDRLFFNRIIPEGIYDICLIALDYDNPQPIPLSEACTSIDIVYPSRPIILQPQNNSIIPEQEIHQVNISWTIPEVADPEILSRIKYQVKMINLTESGSPNAIEALFDPGVPVVIEEELIGSFFQVQDIPLEVGNIYAIRVKAIDPLDEIAFQFNGESEPVEFIYGKKEDNQCQDPPYSTAAAFPLTSDTIPFQSFPFTLQFQPYCDSYNLFNGKISIFDKEGNSVYKRDVENRWPHGALKYLHENVFSDATEFEASHLALNDPNDQIQNGSLIRGESYRWEVKSSVTHKTLNKEFDSNFSANFNIGMPKPQVKSPIKGKKVAPGEVQLSWFTGNAPKQTIPPFPIVNTQGKGNNVVKFFGLNGVDEKYVVQISRDPEFKRGVRVVESNNVTYTLSELDMKGNRYDPEKINSALYTDKSSRVKATEPGDYYWRILYLNNPTYSDNLDKLTSNQYYRKSAVGHFIIEDSTGNDCTSECEQETPADKEAISVVDQFSELQIGKFRVTNFTLREVQNKVYSGTGNVKMEFINDLNLRVNLRNIKVNSKGEIFEGVVEGHEDSPEDNLSFLPGTIRDFLPEQIERFDKYIHAGRIISSLERGTQIGLPLAFDLDFNETSFLAGITKITFLPKKAHLQLLVNLNFPALDVSVTDDNWISLAASEICITPEGFGKDFILHLNQDLKFHAGGDIFMVFKGSGGNLSRIKQSASYIHVNCEGVQSAAFRAEAHFMGRNIVPEDINGNPTDGIVKGYFELKYDKTDIPDKEEKKSENLSKSEKRARGNNWVVQYNMDDFQIKGLEGWGFQVNEGYFDFSSMENPPGIKFPQGYTHTSINKDPSKIDSSLLNTWTGFYLKSLTLKSPPNLLKNKGRATIGIENIIIDPKFTASIRAHDLIKTYEGRIDDWAFSLDTFHVDLVQNEFTGGGFSGKVGLPLMDAGEYLGYKGLVSKKSDESEGDHFDFVLNIQPTDEITFPALLAEVNLYEESYINVQLGRKISGAQAEKKKDSKPPNRSFIEAGLVGKLTIRDDLAGRFSPSNQGSPIPFSLPGIGFELAVRSGEGILPNPTFSLASPKKELAGFPLDIGSIDLTWDGDAIDLTIEPRISIIGEKYGVSFSTRLNIRGQLHNTDNDGLRFGYRGLKIDKVSLDKLDLASVSVSGELEWYNERSGPGGVGKKGLKGKLNVELPMGVSTYLAAEFGNQKTIADAEFGSKDYFGYWYFDGLVNFGAGIPITSGFAIYGFGGGFAYNMQKKGGATQEFRDLAITPEKTKSAPIHIRNSGFSYEPAYENREFNIQAIMGTHPNSSAFNMNVGVAAAWNENGGGLTNLSIQGSGYVMEEIKEGIRGDKPFWAEVKLDFYRDRIKNIRIIEGKLNVFLDLGIIKGDGTNNKLVEANFLTQNTGGPTGKGKWYFHIGRTPGYDPGPAKAKIGIKRVSASAEAYFMIGYDIPSQLPPPPDFVLEMLGLDNREKDQNNGLQGTEMVSQRAATGEERSPIDLSSFNDGRGFATGLRMGGETDIDAAIVYATLKVAAGFDINVSKNDSRYCYSSGENKITPGRNGWYGIGQVYAGLEGDIGVQLKIIKKRRFSIFKLGAAVMLNGGAPDPIWVEGRAGIKFSVLGGLIKGRKHFTISIGERCIPQSNNPFAGIKLINEFNPNNQENKVNVFTDPRVSFNLPIGSQIDFPTLTVENGKEIIQSTKIRAVIENVSLKSGKEEIKGRLNFDSDRVIGTYRLDQMLKGSSPYEFSVSIKAQELRNGRWEWIIDDHTNQPWIEDSTIVFHTGRIPDSIPDNQVVFTNPIKRQNYFLQGEPGNKKGTLGFTKVLDQMFPSQDESGNPYTYSLRIISIDGTEPPKNISLSSKNLRSNTIVNFSIPPLSSSKIYSLQLVRGIRSKITWNSPLITNSLTFPMGRTDQISKSLTSTEPITTLNQSIQRFQNSQSYSLAITDKARYDIILATKIDFYSRAKKLLPGRSVKPHEKLLYHYYFRTSQFSTFSEKVKNASILKKGVEYGGGDIGIAYMDIRLGEPLDIIDIMGFFHENKRILEPRVEVADPMNSGFYRNIANPYLYRFIHTHPFKVLSTPGLFPIHKGIKDLGSTNYRISYSMNVFGDRLTGKILKKFKRDRVKEIGQFHLDRVPNLKVPVLSSPLRSIWGTKKIILNSRVDKTQDIMPALSNRRIAQEWDEILKKRLSILEEFEKQAIDRQTFNGSIYNRNHGRPMISINPSLIDIPSINSSFGPKIRIYYDPVSSISSDANSTKLWMQRVLYYRMRTPSGMINQSLGNLYPYNDALRMYYPEFISRYTSLLYFNSTQVYNMAKGENFNLEFYYNSSFPDRRHKSNYKTLLYSY